MRKYYYLLLFVLLISCKKDESKTETTIKACFTILNPQIHIGDTISFSNCSENSVSYHWDFGDGLNSSDKEPTHIYNKIGVYDIMLIASNNSYVDTFSTKISVLPLPDNISYKELSPTIQLNTVNSITNYDFGICTEERPTPMDSTTFWDLDIDSDLKNDFRFVVKHLNWATINPSQYCGHCNIYVYFVDILALTPGDAISVYRNSDNGPKCYAKTESVATTDSWGNSDHLYIKGGCRSSGIPNFTFQDTYIGVKHQNKLGWIHIIPFGINGIEIKEFALNNTENNPIRAGRRE